MNFERGEHVHAISTCIQRMQKVLTQMNIQLATVISDLSGWTGQRIVRAMLAGERDPQKLAALSHPAFMRRGTPSPRAWRARGSPISCLSSNKK